MLKALRARLDALIAERREKVEAMRVIREAAEAEARADLSEVEQATWSEARSRIGEIDAAMTDLQERIAELEEQEAREADLAAARSAADDGDPEQRGAPHVRVTDEPLTYEEHSPHSFFRDAWQATHRGDASAQERIGRHAREMDVVYQDYRGERRADGRERRASPSANYSGLVVPQYLIDEFAEVARAGRPFLDLVRDVPLPDTGMTVNIGLGTTGTSVAAQATENSAVSNTDYDDTLLTVQVRTYAGQQVVSRQAVERGQTVDEILAEDLLSAYYTSCDAGAIASDGTSGTHKGVLSASGINAVTYTDATPTVGELYSKIADAAWNQVPANIFRGVDALVMAPRRFAWIMAAVDTQGRPIAVPLPNGAVNAVAAGGEGPAYGPTGYGIQGVPIYTDANVPVNLGAGTNEDRIIAIARRELIFWEDPQAPLQLRFEETKGDQLSILMVLYGYSAFTAERRPKATSVISGTGLITPTF